MKAAIKILITTFVVLTSAYAHEITPREQFYRDRMIRNMQLASIFVIEDGVSAYRALGYRELFNALVDDWGVQLWTEPQVETEFYLAKFVIKASGIYYDIHNLYREVVDGTIYEFWLIKVAPRSWSGETLRSEFFVTRTDEVFGHREILLKSDQFVEDYDVNSEATIVFPADDLELLYIMKPWDYPDQYGNSYLTKMRVEMTEDGPVRVKCFLGICREVSN